MSDGLSPHQSASATHAEVDDRVIARALADFVAAIGSAEFPRRLLATLHVLGGVELCSVFERSNPEQVDLIFATGELPGFPEFPSQASHAYSRRFWRSDRQLQRLARLSANEPVLARRRAVDIADPAYRTACYDRARVDERISIISSEPSCLIINGYRSVRSAPFAPRDVERLELHAGLLVAGLRQHLRAGLAVVGQIDEATLAGTLTTLNCGLSAREAEITAALILGETQVGIAKAKHLSPATVVTYRRRAYSKLGVSNRRDLVALHRRLVSDRGRITMAREGE